MEERYECRNRRKYSLQAHIILVTKYRKPLLVGLVDEYLKHFVTEVCAAHRYRILAMETDQDHIHLLISYDTTECVSNIVKYIKQYTTFHLWEMFESLLQREFWKRRTFWSDGYFACSIGEVSQSTIIRYIESQG